MPEDQYQLPSLPQGQYLGLPSTNIPGLSPVTPGMQVRIPGMEGLAGTGFDNMDDYLKFQQGNYIKDQMNQSYLGMSKGTLQGLQGIAGLAGTLGGMYYQGKQNDRAEDVLNMQKQDRNNQYASNKKWNEGIAASGLGTATRAVQG